MTLPTDDTPHLPPPAPQKKRVRTGPTLDKLTEACRRRGLLHPSRYVKGYKPNRIASQAAFLGFKEEES